MNHEGWPGNRDQNKPYNPQAIEDTQRRIVDGDGINNKGERAPLSRDEWIKKNPNYKNAEPIHYDAHQIAEEIPAGTDIRWYSSKNTGDGVLLDFEISQNPGASDNIESRRAFTRLAAIQQRVFPDVPSGLKAVREAYDNTTKAWGGGKNSNN
jgi:hypothetical protein